MTGRTVTWSALATTWVVASAWPAAATSGSGGTSAALVFWMTWGLMYLAVGAALMAVATAAAVRERRAWSSLLTWTADARCDAPPDDGADVDEEAVRAA